MKKILLPMAMMISLSSFAQDPYTLTTYTSAYTELTGAIVIPADDVDEDTWDDPFFIVPFGFDFSINGGFYDTAFQFGPGALMGFGSINLVDSTLIDTTLSAFGLTDDIIDGDYIDGLSSSEISYQIQGTAGSHIAIIQYKNAAYYNEVDGPEPAAENRTNFQLWFYEEDGIMEIHFGASNITNPDLVYDGNLGPITAVILSLNLLTGTVGYVATISGDTSNPELLETDIFTGSPVSLNSTPESGRVYRLAPSGASSVIAHNTPKFSIYPTLAQSEIWVKSELTLISEYRILDITGKEVQMGTLQFGNPLNVSTLNPGLYLLSIIGMESAVKFVKQ